VTNIVDGDTFDATVDLGFHATMALRFRMLGIDTPELRPRGGTAETRASEKKAALAAKSFLSQQIYGKLVNIETAKGDSFGRWLAEVHLDDVNINCLMIEAGHAKKYR
jgi:micrococcal nuclease